MGNDSVIRHNTDESVTALKQLEDDGDDEVSDVKIISNPCLKLQCEHIRILRNFAESLA